MNKFIGIGRITKDVQAASTSNGITTSQFTIAINRNFKNKDGNYDADFINCVAFRNTAEFINKYCKKGNQISVEGRIQVRSYEDKNNQKKYITEIVVDNVMLLERKKQDSESEQIEMPQNASSEYDNEKSDVSLTDADLPF